MKVESLIGTQRIDPVPCPRCGHRFEQYSGMPGGTASEVPAKGALLLMVCERCESVVARVGDAMLALTREQEQQLPAHAQDAINQTRQLVQATKRMSPSRN